MSQPEENPSVILRRFANNLIDRMEELQEDSLARELCLAVEVVVQAAADTANQMEILEENNESA
jgi:hypothetical protein